MSNLATPRVRIRRNIFGRRVTATLTVEMCRCSAIPTPHHPGWCVDFTGAPDSASWDAFELVTFAEWARS